MAASANPKSTILKPARIASALAIACSLALAGCSGGAYPVSSVSAANDAVANGYTVSSGDQLKITVFDEPALTGEFEIDSSGDLAMPLVEKLSVAGQTPKQVASMITTTLKNGGYVLDPKVSVEVMQYRPVYVLGEVAQPGEYPYSPDLNFFQAVAKAGGFTPRANKTTVILQRSGWTSPRTIKLSGEQLMIAPGDTVMIEESFL